MTRLLAVAALCLLPVAAGAADEQLSYTPPAAPTPPDPANLLTRLLLMTTGVMVLCAVVLWLARRAQRGPTGKGDPTGRFQLDGSLAIDRRSAVHLIRVDGQAVAVTTDATGLRSITLLSESFDTTLAEAGRNIPTGGGRLRVGQ